MLPRNGPLIVRFVPPPLPIDRRGTGTVLMSISSPRNTRTRRPRGPSRSNVSSRRRVIGSPEVRLILCWFPSTTRLINNIRHLLRHEGCNADQRPDRVLFPAEMRSVSHGRGLLCSVCSGNAPSRHSRVLDFDLLRSSKFTSCPPWR